MNASVAQARVAPPLGTQVRHLARRSVVRALRDPGAVLPTLAVPLILFAVVASGLSAADEIPGFPTQSFTTFALTIAFANGALVTIANTGQAMATDIESGFMNRLSLTPMNGPAFLGAQLTGCLLLGIVQAVLFLGVGIAAGADIETGALGAVVLVIMFLVAVLGFGAFGMFVGLQTGSGQAVQAIAPLMTVFLFLSSVNMPRNLIEKEWFYWIATVNPLSYLVEGLRSLLISSWDALAVGLGFAVAGVILLLSLIGAVHALNTRMERT